MYILGLILFIVHIMAFVAGGTNAVIMPVIGPKLATATPEVRAQLLDIVAKVSKVGKWAFATLLVTGVLVLWLKWNWVVPNVWFWIKMAFVALMVVFIALNEMAARRGRAGDPDAMRQSARFGQLTGIAFLGVIVAAVFAFEAA